MANTLSRAEFESAVGMPDTLFARHRQEYRAEQISAVQAMLALRGTAQRIDHEIAAWCAPWGLTPSTLNVLATLWAVGGGPLPLSKISRFLVTTRTNVTGLVDRLEGAGLIERRPNPDDRRSTLISLNAKGARLVRRVLGGYFDHLDAALSALTANERLTLLSLLAKVNAGLKRSAKPGIRASS